MFACKFAEYVTRDAEITFTQVRFCRVFSCNSRCFISPFHYILSPHTEEKTLRSIFQGIYFWEFLSCLSFQVCCGFFSDRLLQGECARIANRSIKEKSLTCSILIHWMTLVSFLLQWSLGHKPFEPLVICDMIKRNESDVRDIVLRYWQIQCSNYFGLNCYIVFNSNDKFFITHNSS